MRKGQSHSEETKRKISEKTKGMTAWNKGLTKEDARVMKYAEKLKGRKFSEEHKEKLKVPKSKEHRKKLSEQMKKLFVEGKINPILNLDGYIRVIGDKNPFYGKHHIEKTIEKIRLIHLGKKDSEETRKKKSIARIGSKNPMFGKHLNLSEEHKRKISQTSEERWQEPKYREMNIKAIMKAQHRKPNQKEIILGDIIKSLSPDYIFVGDGGKFSNVEPTVINGRVPDFINVNGQKKAINFNGTYWHLQMKQKDNPNLTKEQVEEMEKEPYKKLGWDLLIIWEDELKDRKIVMEKIQEFQNSLVGL